MATDTESERAIAENAESNAVGNGGSTQEKPLPAKGLREPPQTRFMVYETK
jgi:hypothetical protein